MSSINVDLRKVRAQESLLIECNQFRKRCPVDLEPSKAGRSQGPDLVCLLPGLRPDAHAPPFKALCQRSLGSRVRHGVTEDAAYRQLTQQVQKKNPVVVETCSVLAQFKT
jgi:hypothetical protein